MKSSLFMLLGLALVGSALSRWDVTQPRLVLLGKRRMDWASNDAVPRKVPSKMILLGKRGNAEIVNGMLAYDFDKLIAAGKR